MPSRTYARAHKRVICAPKDTPIILIFRMNMREQTELGLEGRASIIVNVAGSNGSALTSPRKAVAHG